jgi:hypothetical protein
MQSAITRNRYGTILLSWRAGRASRQLRAGDRVARTGNAAELRHHGAHLVVHELGELVDGPTPQALARGTD